LLSSVAPGKNTFSFVNADQEETNAEPEDSV
jgi:hypothetical protein